jgi:hypothetical protein
MAEQQKTAAVAEAETINLDEFGELLEKDFKVKKDDSEKLQQLVRNLALAAQSRSDTTAISSNAIKSIKSLIAGIDKVLTERGPSLPRGPRDGGHVAWPLVPREQHRDRPETQDPGDEHHQGRTGRYARRL